jgi:Rrf2 family protein
LMAPAAERAEKPPDSSDFTQRGEAVKKWDWLRVETAKTLENQRSRRCLSQFFHSLGVRLVMRAKCVNAGFWQSEDSGNPLIASIDKPFRVRITRRKHVAIAEIHRLRNSMFTKTTRSAIRMATHLGMVGSSEPVSPRALAEQLGESPTYLAKVARHLVKAGILRAHRGVAGGVVLGRNPRDITLLAIVEACQGTILGDFCEEADDLAKTCAFHQACAELHESIVGVLSKWTLAQFIERPRPIGMLGKQIPCWLEKP